MTPLTIWKATLFIHILAGLAACISGAAAMIFRKGGPRHRQNGNIFTLSMVTLGVSAIYLAYQRSDVGNFVAGFFVLYLVGTAWLAARRPDNVIGKAEWAGFIYAAVGSVVMVYFGYLGWQRPRHMMAGGPAAALFVLAAVVAMCAWADLRMIRRGGLAGTARVARHLWRMCLALFIASGSFFFARQRIIFHPMLIKMGLPLVFLFGPLVLMWYWMRRVKKRGEFQRA